MNEWTLYKFVPKKDYPSVTYLWVNELGKIVYQRSVEDIGYMPIKVTNMIGTYIEDYLMWQFKKVNHKMNDVQLAKGWLVL